MIALPAVNAGATAAPEAPASTAACRPASWLICAVTVSAIAAAWTLSRTVVADLDNVCTSVPNRVNAAR